MINDRVHRVTSQDGTAVAGRVHGQGPPLVLVHGAVADAGSEWGALLPYLTERFTCYLPDMRGRGLSGDHPDHSREARVRDVAAFVDSIGEPVGLMGVSGGAMLVLAAAARTAAVTAVVAREPVVFEVIAEDLRARFRQAVERMAKAAGEGHIAEAVQPFLDLIANDEETAALSADPQGLDELGHYLPVDVEEFREALEFSGPSPTDASVLQRIAAPVLVVHGSHTALPWFRDSVRYVAHNIANATVQEVTGSGHLGHLIAPARDAHVVVPFLETHLSGASTTARGRPLAGAAGALAGQNSPPRRSS